MSKKIALINPRKGWRPAMGLLYIASYLKNAGYAVKVFEFIDENYNTYINKKIWRQFRDFDPDFVGLGVISWNRKIASEIIRNIRATTRDKIIICGGKDPSYVPEKYLSYSADVVTIGEGEKTIIELLKSYEAGSDLEDVRGIAFMRDGKVIKTAYREPISLEELLPPAFDLVDYKHYTNIKLGGIPGHFIKTGFMMANRGCPFKCTFCLENVRNVYRERTVENMIDEIKWQIKDYGIKGMVFLDDLFYYKDQRVIDFCERVLKDKIKLKFYAQTRVDSVGRKETLALMRRAGFIQLALGVESGSPEILKKVNKGLTVGQIKSGVKAINDAGLYSYSYMIIGLPFENEEDMEMTEGLLREIKSTFVAVNYYMPMPGTPLYNQEDDKLLDNVSYSLTENQTFRPLQEQRRMGHYRAKFQSMGQKNPNLNLFKYASFYLFLFEVLFLHPLVLLKGIMVQKKKRIYSSYFEAVRTAMINYRIYG